MPRFIKLVMPELMLLALFCGSIGGAVHAYFANAMGWFGFALPMAIISGCWLLGDGISWIATADNNDLPERIDARLAAWSCKACGRLEKDNARLLQRASEAEQALVKLKL